MVNAKNIGLAALAIGCVLGVLSFFGISLSHSGVTAGSINNGAAVQNYPFWFTNGFYGGSTQQFSVDSSGNLTETGSATVSGVTNLTKPTFCINFYATSTATQLYMVASTTGTLPNGAGAVLTANYGSCS